VEKLFKLAENKTTVRTEVVAGITTFLTMSYIIFVQPAVISQVMPGGGDPTGVFFGAVFMATCLSAAIATILMAFLANYPIGLAPGMGQNFYFAFTVCLAVQYGGLGYSWQTALGAVFIAGVIFLILSFFKIREKIMDVIPHGLKLAIPGGIGLLIAYVGLQWAGLIERGTGALIKLGDPTTPWALLSIVGIIVTGVLLARKVRGAILIGILVTAIVGLFIKGGANPGMPHDTLTRFQGIAAPPPSLAPTFLKLHVSKFFDTPLLWEVVFIFLFLDLFDTVGTLIGVGHAAGFLTKEGKLPRAGRALMADAAGTVIGASLGTSTVTSYVESSTGIAEGGRTGLAAVVTGVLFALAVFFSPLVRMVGGGYNIAAAGEAPDIRHPVIAAPLIVVGSLMMRGLKGVEWDDWAVAIASFLTMIMMPLTLSIATGISYGFIAYVAIRLLSGRGKEVHWLMYLLAGAFILRYAFIRV
jgi:AGZA family xanthine/uracil permease-like MFS transporter